MITAIRSTMLGGPKVQSAEIYRQDIFNLGPRIIHKKEMHAD